jgi:hypothetical protein
MTPFALHQDTCSTFLSATQVLSRLVCFNTDFISFYLLTFRLVLTWSLILFGSPNLHYLTYTPSVLRYKESDFNIRNTNDYICLLIKDPFEFGPRALSFEFEVSLFQHHGLPSLPRRD